MNKNELVSRTTKLLNENDIRKTTPVQKTVFHISDDQGNQSDFVIKKTGNNLLFNTGDVSAIVDACLTVVLESLKQGEEVSIQGFGSLRVQHRKGGWTRHPKTGETVAVPERYVPKFESGKSLKMAAKIYELSLEERKAAKKV